MFSRKEYARKYYLEHKEKIRLQQKLYQFRKEHNSFFVVHGIEKISSPKTKHKPHLKQRVLTQEIFDKIKHLLWEGNTMAETARIMGISDYVIGRVNKTGSVEEYYKMNTRLQKEWQDKRRKKAEEDKKLLTKALFDK